MLFAEATTQEERWITNHTAGQRGPRCTLEYLEGRVFALKLPDPVLRDCGCSRWRGLGDQQCAKPRKLQDRFDGFRGVRNDERPVDPLQLFVKFHQHADTGRAQVRDLRQVEPNLMRAFTNHLVQPLG